MSSTRPLVLGKQKYIIEGRREMVESKWIAIFWPSPAPSLPRNLLAFLVRTVIRAQTIGIPSDLAYLLCKSSKHASP